ncbi:MAG: cellulase family glycosylhydrolase [Dehalococcoidia bacterium]|nr:cellulase family glycosylhydrolase [Dehalococcoidia bacterium]
MIRIEGVNFKDDCGRTVILRGVNLDAKVPFKPDGSTHIREGFFDHRNVSFVGRPFPLDEADEHFSRLKSWGLTFYRFLVPWEALEHSGPGVYDEEYLDYLYKMVKKAGEYGLLLYIETRQDMWSRFTGGCGAPGWTFDAVGLDITKFKETGAAITHQEYGSDYAPQIWATNGFKMAAATMFTLFFGGNDFAPSTKVDGRPVQEYLQSHLLSAYKKVAERLKGLPAVLGYDTMNEPYRGYIACSGLNSTDWYLYKKGDTPTAYQGMLLAAGCAQEVEVWRAFPPKKLGTRLLNPRGVKAWKEGFDCIWRANGVWDFDRSGKPVLLQPGYFSSRNNREVNFIDDYQKPYFERFADTIHAVDPQAMILITPPNVDYRPPYLGADNSKHIVYKPHWYDDVHWITKAYHLFPHALVSHDKLTGRAVIGTPGMVQRSFNDQMRRIKEFGDGLCGGVPTVIGEIGICYDMNKREAFRTGDYSAHIKEWDRLFKALDANLLSYNLWTYDAFNDNKYGDHWNLEDFSIYGLDQRKDPTDINSGGRALQAVVRPYPRAIAGRPLRISFDIKKRVFEFEFRHDPAVVKPTEIFVPDYQYPNGYDVRVSDGWSESDAGNQLLIYTHGRDRETHTVRIIPRR